HRSSDRRFGACGQQRRCEKKIPSSRGFSILQPKLNDDVHTTAQLAAGDARARQSRLQVDEGRARRAMSTMQTAEGSSSPTLSDSGIGSTLAGENEGPNPCEMQIG